jgi:large subunit ribosomal protein L18
MKIKVKRQKKQDRQKRVRAKITGTPKRPRLSVFKSLKYIKVQLIDDIKGETLLSASDSEIKDKKLTKTEKAKELGKLIAKKALDKNIKSVVFDRAGYKYHGRVKAVAEGARAAGLEF